MAATAIVSVAALWRTSARRLAGDRDFAQTLTGLAIVLKTDFAEAATAPAVRRYGTGNPGAFRMKLLILSATFTLALAACAAGPAEAKGCIKGAIVGGVAGHMANHGVLGAAGGCAVGRHMASQKQKETEIQQQQQMQQPSYR